MPSSAAKQPASLVLVCGDDEFAVKQRAKQLFQQWSQELGGMDHEMIDAGVSNSGEALKVIARLREALQTLPFFGGGKAVWLQNCNFLGDERAASAQAVTETLGELAQELKDFSWGNVRLLISAGKVDKRKVFYKTIDKLGEVESFAGLSIDDKDWMQQAETMALQTLRGLKKEISDEALAELVANVGPSARQLNSEAEKLALYVGERRDIELDDVAAICTRNKSARAFALGDALGDRDLPKLLRRLDEELWEMKFDSQKSEIGLLYGLISKVRAMILLKEMVREGWIKPAQDYQRFKAQLERVPVEKLPEDKRFNPLSINPYILFKAFPQSQRYSQPELIRAMDLLLKCNQRLISSSLDEALILQQTLIEIVGSAKQPLRA
ncbi:DNA polymerase III subunit delta [Pedosphaera parvula]|uniref:DNA polymerase III delta n=1 Tax=Pedosphaera parvula (strain Ellin514) TaxID=320771 RepID=B9XNK6_PEDPL|nr:DNA polymerase III delta [Pedosphaera parvula]EEF58546.1 DNA polymerase III delta [Pedosphaera parvula Ellin514]